MFLVQIESTPRPKAQKAELLLTELTPTELFGRMELARPSFKTFQSDCGDSSEYYV